MSRNQTLGINTVATLAVTVIMGLLGYISYQLKSGNDKTEQFIESFTTHAVNNQNMYKYEIKPTIDKVNELDGRVTFLEERKY